MGAKMEKRIITGLHVLRAFVKRRRAAAADNEWIDRHLLFTLNLNRIKSGQRLLQRSSFEC
jgi:hypothetical protein